MQPKDEGKKLWNILSDSLDKLFLKESESKRNACFRGACPVNFLKTQKCGPDSFVALNVQFLKSVSYRFLSAALVFAGQTAAER